MTGTRFLRPATIWPGCSSAWRNAGSPQGREFPDSMPLKALCRPVGGSGL
jgi:hypothetical protein